MEWEAYDATILLSWQFKAKQSLSKPSRGAMSFHIEMLNNDWLKILTSCLVLMFLSHISSMKCERFISRLTVHSKCQYYSM